MGPSKMQAKTPGMFSLNSLAYWLNASTSHLAAVPEIASLMLFFFQGTSFNLFVTNSAPKKSTDFAEFLFKTSNKA